MTASGGFPAYRVVIGLEIHVQLQTESKMFCGCSADYANAAPNSHVCPICLGMPGVLPVINRMAVDHTIMTGLALHCDIPEQAKFDRKNYAYPDLMKWYQISQYDLPFCIGGWLDVKMAGVTKRVGIRRVHLEEDTAKLTHVTGDDGQAASLIDVNRSGVPLMEIVSEPDIEHPEEAVAYGLQIRNIMRWLQVSTGNMQDGALRIDANISVWPDGHEVGDVKVEVKNMNSFRALGRALEFEMGRQRNLLERGEDLIQETRGWNERSSETVPQRSKEYAHDYRYFPDPDLPPLRITRSRVDGLSSHLPALPADVEASLIDEYAAPPADVAELIGDKTLTDYALSVIDSYSQGADVITWIVHDVRSVLNSRGISSAEIEILPREMAALLELRKKGEVSSTMAGEILNEMFESGDSVAAIVDARGRQISDEDELLAIARDVIVANPKAVEDYHAGKERAVQFLMGQVMRATKGKANPGKVTELLLCELQV